MSVIWIAILCLLTLGFTAMSVAFAGLSTSHLRHWARQKDQTAIRLYPLKARGMAVLLTIELFRAVSLAAAFVLLASRLGPWQAWAIAALLFFLAFVVFTQLYLKALGLRLLATFSQSLLWLTQLFKPLTLTFGRLLDRFIDDEPVTLTKAELTHLVEGVDVDDTDLSAEELRIFKHALKFGDKTVHDVMTPRGQVKTVKANEKLSPVVIDELYKSGHSRFPAIDSDGKTAVGVLYMHDLTELRTEVPQVKEVMHKNVSFVNEDRELDHVLQAFLKSKQHLFIVVDASAEMVGVVTIEDIVEQILGKPIIDEFDMFDDRQAVAEARARQTDKQTAENMVE